MNQITDPPQQYDAGLDFNYASWTANTTLTLANVPWNSDYRDVVRFPSRNALINYITGLGTANTVIANSRYAKVNEPVRVEMPFNAAIKYNYLMATNHATPTDVRRTYFYFITDVRYVTPSVTELVVQLDVWQCFNHDVEFGNCYVERGHIGIANENNFANYGRDYLTVPEGLDTGGEYRIVTHRSEDVYTNRNEVYAVVSSTLLLSDPGTVDDPKISVPQGSSIGQLGQGAAVYFFKTMGDLQLLMNSLRDAPWLANGIMSVKMVPDPVRWYPNREFGSVKLRTNDNTVDVIAIGEIGLTGNGSLGQKATNRPLRRMFDNWRNSTEISSAIPARYRHLRKLYTYPYMVIEATTWTGSPLILKPESWNADNAPFFEWGSAHPTAERLTFTAAYYNARNTASEDGDDGGEMLDAAVHIDGWPQVPFAADQSMLAMAQNAHGLAHQFNSADWSQQRALRGADTAYNQASNAMSTANQLNAQNNANARTTTNYANQSAMQSAIMGSVSGIGQGAVTGAVAGPAGIAAGAAGGLASAPFAIAGAAMEADRARGMTEIGIDHANATNRIQQNSAAFMRDSNMDLAQFAANGDYANTVAGLNAKVQDMQFAQPSVVGQFGGQGFNLEHGVAELSVRWKMIDRAAMATVGEFWLRYGYAVQRFARIPSDFMAMSKFTYWKLSETYISSAPMPELYKQTIRGIFEKGVTVWADPADIGNIDIADNQPRSGITL